MAAPRSQQNRRVAPGPGQDPGGPDRRRPFALRTLTGLRWLTWLAVGSNLAAGLLDLAWLPHVSWWWLALGWLLLVSPPGRMVVSAAGARLLLRGVAPGASPPRRQGAPAALAGRAARRRDGRRQPGGRAVDAGLRASARRRGRQARRPARDPAGDAGCSPSATGARSSPRSTCAGHWLDGDVLHLGRVDVGPVGAGRCPQHAAARCRRRRARRDRPGLRGLRRRAGGRGVVGRAGPARSATRAAPGAASVPRNRPRWLAAYAAMAVADRRRSRSLAFAGRRRGRRRRRCRGTDSLAEAAASGRRLGARWRVVVGSSPSPCSCGRWSACSRGGWSRGTTRCTAGRPGRPGRCCGSSTRPAPGSSRSTPAR